MEIAFRKGDTSFASKMIRWWTKKPYSHCELVFSNGLTFSAYIEDFKTSFKNKEHLPEEWDFLTIPITLEEEQKIYKFCLEEVNCYYDIIGLLFTQILPLSFENPYWWFCSEVCVSALQQIEWILNTVSYETDPGELYNILKEKLSNE